LATLYYTGCDGFQVVDGGPSSSWAKPKQFLSGGGGAGRGLISTATDYARFAQMLLNSGEFNGERILSRKTVELMTHNHLPLGIETPFKKGLGLGLGLWIMEDVAQSFGMGTIGSFGWDGGDGTRFWVDPTEEMIGIIMAQSLGAPWVAQDQFPILAYQAIDD
jgi:CubicO group peptidase (beta-lactamase class C family)